jgi:hypothetical protein
MQVAATLKLLYLKSLPWRLRSPLTVSSKHWSPSNYFPSCFSTSSSLIRSSWILLHFREKKCFHGICQKRNEKLSVIRWYVTNRRFSDDGLRGVLYKINRRGPRTEPWGTRWLKRRGFLWASDFWGSSWYEITFRGQNARKPHILGPQCQISSQINIFE